MSLFERKTQPLRFTAAGERLLTLAHDLNARVAAAERDLARLRQGEAGNCAWRWSAIPALTG